MVRIKFIILFAALVSALYGQSIQIEAKTDSTEYFVGDFIHYNIRIERDKDVSYVMPSVKDSVNTLEFISEEGIENYETDEKLITEYNYTFSWYDSTEITIPSFFISYTVGNDSTSRLAATNEVYLVVKTLEVNPEEDIQDIKAPLLIPMDWLFLILVIAGVLVLGLVAYFIFKYYEKKKLAKAGEVPVVIIPPFEEAMQSLKALEEEQLWQQGKIKEFHSEITHIIRKYFERKFDFLALEMPSSEVLMHLKNVKEAGKIFDITARFLSNADMVKFAKFVPLASVNEEMLRQAYEIVNSTKPVIEVKEEESAEVENV